MLRPHLVLTSFYTPGILVRVTNRSKAHGDHRTEAFTVERKEEWGAGRDMGNEADPVHCIFSLISGFLLM